MGKHGKDKDKNSAKQFNRPEVEAARIDADVEISRAQRIAREQKAREEAHGPGSQPVKRGWIARKLLGDD